MNDVDLVGGTERLGQHVVNACALEYCTHGATCDNTGTSGCRAEHHNACSCLTLHAVRDGATLDAGNAEEVLLCFLDTLGDCCGNFLSLTVANADQAVTVTNDDQCGEAEATTTLDDLGNAVDGHNALDVLVLLLLASAVVTALTTATTLAAVVAALLALVGGLSGFSYYCFAHLSFLYVLLAH